MNVKIESKKPRPRPSPEFVLEDAVAWSGLPAVIDGPDRALDALREARKEARGVDRHWGNWHLDDVVRQIAELTQASKYIAFQLGRMYRIAHQLGPEGGFKKFVADLGMHSYSHVCALIRVYKLCLGREENVENIPNTILLKICEGTFPEDLREQMLAFGVEEGIRVREIIEAGVKVASGEWSLGCPEVRRLIRQSQDEQLRSAAYGVLKDVKDALQDAIKRLEKIQWQDGYEDEPPTQLQKNVAKAIRLFQRLDKQIGWVPPKSRSD